MRMREANQSAFLEIAGARRGRPRLRWAGIVLAALGVWLAVLPSGCYDPQRGAPVDKLHYDHAILVRDDLSHVRIRTFINRTHLVVGLQTEDLYDGDRDGGLTTEGMDRVAIADYVNVEDPPDAAVRRTGDLRDYDSLFREILEAAREGQRSFKIEGRTYGLQMYSQDLNATPDTPNLG